MTSRDERERAADPAARDADESAGADARLDPELAEDLGPELEFRGDRVTAEIESLRDEAASFRDAAQRIQADFENYRKRVERDRTDALKRASEGLVVELLPVIDNLERAIDHATAAGGAGDLLGGVEAVYQQVLGVLARQGVTVMDPFGHQFDPHLHQAVNRVEDPEVDDCTVVEVYQKGYDMHGRVIRPAMVVVATGGPAPEAQ